MAKKVAFIATEDNFCEEEFEYTFFPGFAVPQKQKNVVSLTESIVKRHPGYKVLEISTKSLEELGVRLSAFNLTLDGVSVESIYQSSKVFVDGTQYDFLINSTAKQSKKYMKEHASLPLKCFRYMGKEYPLFPKSAFYDYIYIKALMSDKETSERLQEYNAFTDIEFNYGKSINCQARACSIYVFLCKSGKINEHISSFENFIKIYDQHGPVSLV